MNLPLKWHGGKYYLAAKIVGLMPPHLHYVEPFFGGGAVLCARDPEAEGLWLFHHEGVSEVVNDINGKLINFWRVLQDPQTFQSFHRRLEATPMVRRSGRKRIATFTAKIRSPTRSLSSSIAGKADQE